MRADQFPITQWSMVVCAGEGFSHQSQEALATLCKAYWYPLYAFVRRQGYVPEKAQDLTQAFFARLLEKHYIRDCRRELGRFCSFLLASLKHFFANKRDTARAQKRGGGQVCLPLDEVTQSGEYHYSLEPRDNLTPEKMFEKKWAMTLLDQTLRQLQKEFENTGKKDQYARLEGFLIRNDTGVPYK